MPVVRAGVGIFVTGPQGAFVYAEYKRFLAAIMELQRVGAVEVDAVVGDVKSFDYLGGRI